MQSFIFSFRKLTNENKTAFICSNHLTTDHSGAKANLKWTLWMTAVTFSSMVKPGTFLLKVKPYNQTFFCTIECSLTHNNDKGHVYCSWSPSRIVWWSTNVLLNTQFMVETICVILVLLHTHVFVVIAFMELKITELTVTYLQDKKLARNQRHGHKDILLH